MKITADRKAALADKDNQRVARNEVLSKSGEILAEMEPAERAECLQQWTDDLIVSWADSHAQEIAEGRHQ